MMMDYTGLTKRQRTLLDDVLCAVEVLVELEPTQYRAQDDGLIVLRESWERFAQAMPGATTLFAARDIDAAQTG